MTHPSPLCQETLAAMEADPLGLPARLEAHVRTCHACAETRVAWLAMDEAPPAQAPAGYFDQLPGRILGKLPARPSHLYRRPLLWALAAGLLLAVGAGGFWLGQANRQPLVEATLAPAPEPAPAALPETPFQEGDDVISQLHKLSPEEARTLVDRLDSKPAKDPKR